MNVFNEWRQLVSSEFTGYRVQTFQKDLMAGMTVAAVSLPLALAFGVASGASAAAGLVTAIVTGILIGVLGGTSTVVSGPTGAMSAILIVLAPRYGLSGIWVIGILAGIMLIVAGILRLGRVIALIPSPVIAGFTSGIALIIALGQIDNALGIETPAAESVLEKLRFYMEHETSPNPYALGITLLMIAVMIVWQRFPAAKKLPGALLAIIVATLLVWITGWETPLIGEIPRTILLDDRLRFGDLNWRDLGQYWAPAVSVASLGAIESLLVGAVAANMTGKRPRNSVELVAQGIANITIPFFGGIPVAAAIARTSVNIKGGGVTRVALITHGIVLLMVALIFAPIIGRVPLSALAGVLIVTAWRMNEWATIRLYFGKRLKHAITAFVVTVICTVMLDLTQAILIGLVVSAVIFIAQISNVQVRRRAVNTHATDGVADMGGAADTGVYDISGPIIFSAARKLLTDIEVQEGADARILLSLSEVTLIDATGLEVLGELWDRQHQGGGELILANLQSPVHSLLRRSGFLDVIRVQDI